MQLWEGFEVMHNSQYVDIYDRTILRNLGYFLLQVNSRKKIDIKKYLPLPWDKKYRSLEESKYGDDFNSEWLEDYEKKMKQFEEKGAMMEEAIKHMKFESIDLSSMYSRKKSSNK